MFLVLPQNSVFNAVFFFMSFQVDNAQLELIFAVFLRLATRRDALVQLGSFITYIDLKLHKKYKLTKKYSVFTSKT